MIAVPFSYVTDIMPYAQSISGRKFSVDNISLKMSLELIKSLSENSDAFDEESAQRFVSAALYSIFSFIRSRFEGEVKASSIKDARAKEVLSFIDRHLAEPNLTAKKIGDGCSMSSRYVHSLLRQRGTSLKDYVWRSRYDQARARIADPRYSHETIGSIAMHLGFRSNAHFSTGFRKVFGESPSEVRHCALAAVSEPIAPEARRRTSPCSRNFRLNS
jgi:AraC-like DNA-binding protein